MLSDRFRAGINPGLVMALSAPPAALARWLSERPAMRFAAGTHLIEPDARPAHVWYLRDGLVRLYALDAEGAVYNHDFLGAGDWAFGRVLWRAGALCCSERALGVEALQPTCAVRVAMADLQLWQQQDAQVAAYLLDALLQLTASGLAREADLVQRSAEQRYQALLHKQPELLKSVSLRQIAAWLGITPIALSRIRKRLHAPKPRPPLEPLGMTGRTT